VSQKTLALSRPGANAVCLWLPLNHASSAARDESTAPISAGQSQHRAHPSTVRPAASPFASKSRYCHC
jgi:hypothetical protein